MRCHYVLNPEEATTDLADTFAEKSVLEPIVNLELSIHQICLNIHGLHFEQSHRLIMILVLHCAVHKIKCKYALQISCLITGLYILPGSKMSASLG